MDGCCPVWLVYFSSHLDPDTTFHLNHKPCDHVAFGPVGLLHLQVIQQSAVTPAEVRIRRSTGLGSHISKTTPFLVPGNSLHCQQSDHVCMSHLFFVHLSLNNTSIVLSHNDPNLVTIARREHTLRRGRVNVLAALVCTKLHWK